MRKIVLSVIAAAVVLGAGYYGLVAYPGDRFRQELDRALRQLPAGYTASYQAVAYAPFARHATISGFTLRGIGSRRLDVFIDRVELTNLAGDFAAEWARAAADPAATQPTTALRVGAAISVSGATYRLGDASVSVASARVERLDLHPWALMHPNGPALSASLPFLFDRTDLPSPEELPGLLRAQAAQVLGFSFRRVAMDDLRIAAMLPGEAGAPAKAVSYAVRRLTADRYTPGRIGEAVLEGVAGAGDGMGTVAIDRVTLTGIDASRPFGRILTGEAPSRTLFDGLAVKRIEYAGMRVDTPDGSSSLSRRFAISDVAVAQGMPVSAAIAFDGVQFSLKALGQRLGADASQLLDFDGITMDMGAAYDWDVATRRLTLRDIVLNFDQLGRLEMSLDLAEVVPDAPSWETARLVQARLRYVDASLVERALRLGGAILGVEPAQMRQQVLAVIRQQGMALGFNPTVASAITALSEFIRAPGSLTIELKPPASVPLGTAPAGLAARPADFLAALGLRITANQ